MTNVALRIWQQSLHRQHRQGQPDCGSGESNQHDSHTLPEVLRHIETSRGKAVTQAVCDRGYRGKQEVNGTAIILPKKPLKRDNRYQRDKKRKQCRRRAAIEPIIGHLKSDYRLSRNYLKGLLGDQINLLMAATAWNLKKWLITFLCLVFYWLQQQISAKKAGDFRVNRRIGYSEIPSTEKLDTAEMGGYLEIVFQG